LHLNRFSSSTRRLRAHIISYLARFCLHGMSAYLLFPMVRSAAFLALLFFLAPFRSPAQEQSSEYQVKAALIFHFAQLVEWPPDILGPNASPLVMCTITDDSYSLALDLAVDGKQIGGHPIQTKHLRDKIAIHGCHLLVIGAKDKKRAAAIVASVTDEPVLTIGDSQDFAASGGMIGLSLQENKIRFDVNLNSAQRARLKISSRLLLLAKSVIGGGKQG